MLAALVAAGVAMTPHSVSAKIIWFAWTCNSDGYYHVKYENEFGTFEYSYGECGPRMNISPGGGFEVIFSERTQVSAAGMTFLNAVEQRGDMGTPRRAREAGAEKPTGRPETIYLRPADVRPVLAALLTRMDRDWNAAGPAGTRPSGGAFGQRSQSTEISQPVATEIAAILERNRVRQETARLMVQMLLSQSGGSFPGRWEGGGWCWNDDGTFHGSLPCPRS